MLNLEQAKNITVIGGGTAGWFAALALRKILPKQIDIKVIESPDIGIVGVGEGGLINLISTLNYLEIPTSEFMKETGATLKWGFCYEGWRTGQKDDEFYHLFINPKHEPFYTERNGFFPLISKLVESQVPLAHVIKDFDAITNRISQSEAIDRLMQQSGIATSFHFDSYRVAEFLAKKAKGKGISHHQTKVKDICFDSEGLANLIITENGLFKTDFIIDASGFSRLVIGKKLNSEWQSFKDYLLLDRAIPFHLPHNGKNPELVTRATAMKAGWLWQIPLIERIGAGYVFSSKFITEEQAINEVQQYLGFDISPQKTLSFEPGYFKEVWQKNVLALGLSSGFVEPLEATSIGQMLEQLRMFAEIFLQSGGIISDLSIKQYNQANAASWEGIRDFLRMHYDCPRRDTAFWKKIAEVPYPESYKAIKDVFMQRSPRMVDIKGYAQHGWNGIFHVVNWIFIAQALDLISAKNCKKELELFLKHISNNVDKN
ncbi:tryptophan 7-halogenase [Acinetobacter seifertii]|uniref:tryptophan halogenase family protein n=1 Tax=Acinetobacter seifertii TaxID=1530123 RepID=UPI00280DB41C|nr:tryptophan 7-halogenase [Acinetobacter seifertii]MDQ9037262.1 tryptophan 7-halogenase [Acinetobacter seifertii]